MGIIDDLPNLSPAGRKICTTAFLLGLIGAGLATSQIGKVQTMVEAAKQAALTLRVLQLTPEEAASPYPLTNPGSPEEKEERVFVVRRQLEKLREENPDAGNTAKGILKSSVENGILHPVQARHIWDEINRLTIPKTSQPTETTN